MSFEYLESNLKNVNEFSYQNLYFFNLMKQEKVYSTECVLEKRNYEQNCYKKTVIK